MIADAKQLSNSALMHGRTLLAGGALWFNWSGSGFTVRFRGKELKAKMRVMPDKAFVPFGTEEGFDWPCIASLADGSDQPLFRHCLKEDGGRYTLFQGEDGEHCVRIIRLSENNKGKAGLVELETDGELLAPPEEPAGPRIEIVGDSISCGYGNESAEPGFSTERENVLKTYGYLAAKEIGGQYSCVAVSGCSVAAPTWIPGIDDFHAMETLYQYTDKPLESALGQTELTKWDFTKHRSDAVVINLGTNDANEVKMLGFTPKSTEDFYSHYAGLIEQIRRLNGEDTWIVCTLGPMDYYLWDDIRDIADDYRRRSGDKKICCRKLGATVAMTEGSGSDTHPSAATHARMGHELAAILRGCFGKGDEV